jgi:hypothetical protein
MQAADGVAVGGGVQRQDGHRKRLAAVLRVAPAERHEAIEIDLRVAAVLAEVVVDQAGIEQIDAGRNRRVGGEDVVDAGGFEGFFESQPWRSMNRRMRSMARNAEWPSFM